MEKPELPVARELHGTIVTPHPSHLRIYDGLDRMAVCSVEEAEMLVFALSEWIEYKRQLELWERDRENKE